MSETSTGGVVMAILLVVVGLAALAAGGFIVSETVFAEQEQSSASYGPLGIFGEKQSGERTVNAEPIVGLVLVIGGLAAMLSGFAMAHSSFERGKDRQLEREEST